MLIIGERINTSRKAISIAVQERDTAFIQEVARKQVECGADYVDVNAGTLLSNEPDALEWLVQITQEVVGVPLCLDSPNPDAIRRALKVHRGRPIINSITAETDRYSHILPLVKDFNTRIVALTIDDEGMPETYDARVSIASRLIDNLTAEGIAREDIFIDPLVRPISTSDDAGTTVMETIPEVMRRYPGVQTIAGVSNVSFGLPTRKILNQAFMVMLMAHGLSAAIVDPQDTLMMRLILAADALRGTDEYCMNYISASRAGKLEDPKE
jgi:5-methyltetrahydrofolate--homocysteine methyltransferase